VSAISFDGKTYFLFLT